MLGWAALDQNSNRNVLIVSAASIIINLRINTIEITQIVARRLTIFDFLDYLVKIDSFNAYHDWKSHRERSVRRIFATSINCLWLYLLLSPFRHSKCSALCHKVHSSLATNLTSDSEAPLSARTCSSPWVEYPLNFFMKKDSEYASTAGGKRRRGRSKVAASRRYLPSQ